MFNILKSSGEGHSTFFCGCVPHRFPKVGPREWIFLEKWGVLGTKIWKIYILRPEIWSKQGWKCIFFPPKNLGSWLWHIPVPLSDVSTPPVILSRSVLIVDIKSKLFKPFFLSIFKLYLSIPICVRIKRMSLMPLILTMSYRQKKKKSDQFLCFALFRKSNNCPYLCNQMFDCNGLEPQGSIFNAQIDCVENRCGILPTHDSFLLVTSHIVNLVGLKKSIHKNKQT